MMVAYITWLIPLERMLHDEVGIQGPKKTLDGFLWKDANKGRWETDLLSDRMRLLTGAKIGVSLGVADYRHVAIELGRRIQGIMIRALEVEADGNEAPDIDFLSGEIRWGRKTENIWDLQSTHGSIIARRHYALDIRFPYQLQPQMVANFREISRLWHAFLSWDGAKKKGVKRAADEADLLTDGGARSTKKQMAVAQIINGCICKCECGGGKQSNRSGRSEKGQDRHEDARRQQVQQELPLLPPPPPPPPPQQQQGGRVDGDRLKAGLRTLLGEQAEWKSDEQRDGMTKIMGLKNGESLIVVLPTGGGKSILFMLPSVVEDFGTTIVVVPFVALMDDLVDSARRDFGLDCVKWLPSAVTGRVERQPDARLVVVSADTTDAGELTGYVESLRSRGQLRRIVFDECHTAIMDLKFRGHLESVRNLHKYKCPFVLLTATLPVKVEKDFRRFMLVRDAAIVRARTSKLNIRYQVVRVKGGGDAALERGLREAMGMIEARMTPGQKGVIYCRTTTQCEALARKIGCLYHHSGPSMKAADRKAAREAWASGQSESPWMVATTGLGTGINIKGIVGVIHWLQPYGLVEFGQQTGRGGRGASEVVDSVIVTDGREVRVDKHGSDIERLSHDAMESFIRSGGCRRTVLASFMDGVVEDCEELGDDAERCDRCRQEAVEEEGTNDDSDNIEIIEDTNRLKEHRMTEAKRQLAQEQWLHEVGNRCGACYVRWSRRGRKEELRDGYGHKMEECTLIPVNEYSKWRKQLQFADYDCCWGCGLRQAQCEGFGINMETGRCRYKDQVFPVIMMAMKFSRLREMVKMEFGVNFEDEREYIEWIARTRPISGREVTNGYMVWDMLVQCCFGMD
jgi:superfamily II DNA helicase RecQ